MPVSSTGVVRPKGGCEDDEERGERKLCRRTGVRMVPSDVLMSRACNTGARQPDNSHVAIKYALDTAQLRTHITKIQFYFYLELNQTM